MKYKKTKEQLERNQKTFNCCDNLLRKRLQENVFDKKDQESLRFFFQINN